MTAFPFCDSTSVTIDCRILSTKAALLAHLATLFTPMYSLNYDALIDASGMYDSPLTLYIKHLSSYADPQALVEVLDIMVGDNPNLHYTLIQGDEDIDNY